MLGVGRRSIPELAHCRTDFEVTEAAARAKTTRPSLQEVIPVVIFIATILTIVLLYANARPYWLPQWALLLAVLFLAACFALYMSSVSLETGRRRVRAYLLSRGIPLCQSCGYDLSASPAGVTPTSPCPECGQAMGEVASLLQRSHEKS
jgi:predicted RNA-binding Zn-ribbon protein involved in translation (DUF1610 family)